jgi:large subunit ribosomal protein L6
MSRIGKMRIPIPAGVSVGVSGDEVRVAGPKGELASKIPAGISVAMEGDCVRVVPDTDTTDPHVRALHGMVRAVVSNLVTGVSTGFRRVLEIVGTGYRAQMEGKKLILHLGFSKPVEYIAPAGIQISVESPTRIVVGGIDKVLVGQVAADIRAFRGPEPYKGKGIRYEGEYVRKKAGKAAVGAAGG